METAPLLFSTGFVFIGVLYWFIRGNRADRKGMRPADLTGGSISSEKVGDKYQEYDSFFLNPKEIKNADDVPEIIDTFYNLVTDLYELVWGQSFHFSPSIQGKSDKDAIRLHEEMVADLIKAKPGHKILDVGCGVAGPLRAIASYSKANIIGLTINEYQVKRANYYIQKAGLDSLGHVQCGNFLEMPFEDESFNGAYSIEATCHAPQLEDVYREVYRVLKPGALYVSYEWVTTNKYRANDAEHEEIIKGIERANAIPGLRTYVDIVDVAKKVGFEVVEDRDLAIPPAGPWWSKVKMGPVKYWRNHVAINVLAALRLAPKGSADVHKMLYWGSVNLTRGAETGIFSPMHMILCRKPTN